MRKIYLTEQQLNYLVDREVIAESNIIQTIFKGCNTYDEKLTRIISLAKKGIISIGLLSALIGVLQPNASNEEQEQLKQEIVSVMPNNVTQHDNIKYATSFDISSEGLQHIISYEKKRLDAYYATEEERKQGILTVGIGHVVKSNDPIEIKQLKEGDKISERQMTEIFAKDIQQYVSEYKRAVSLLPKKLRNPNLYTQGFIDAGISLTFNAGLGNMMGSDFYQTWKKCRIDPQTGKIYKEDYNFTASKLKRSCITQKGEILNGLVNRRNKEFKMAQI